MKSNRHARQEDDIPYAFKTYHAKYAPISRNNKSIVVIQEDKSLRNLTVREVMEDMETLVQIKYSHRYGQLFTETNPIQRKIMVAFGVTIPT